MRHPFVFCACLCACGSRFESAAEGVNQGEVAGAAGAILGGASAVGGAGASGGSGGASGAPAAGAASGAIGSGGLGTGGGAGGVSAGGAPGSGGNPASAGTSGSGGSPTGEEPRVREAFVFWTSTAAGLIQPIDPGTGTVLGSRSVPAPDAMATPPWTMRSFAPLADGTSRVLWSRAVGAAEVWTLDSNFRRIAARAYTNTAAADSFGSTYRVLPDSSARLIWHDVTTFITDAWRLDAAGVPQGAPLSYTKEGMWVPVSYTNAPNGTGLLLWTAIALSGSPGTGELWLMASDSPPPKPVSLQYGPEWWARSFTQDVDGSARLGLGSTTDGTGQVCQVTLDADEVIVKPTVEGWGLGKCKTYAQQGMVFRGYAARPAP